MSEHDWYNCDPFWYDEECDKASTFCPDDYDYSQSLVQESNWYLRQETEQYPEAIVIM